MLLCLSTTDAAWSIISFPTATTTSTSTSTSTTSLVLGRSADAADVVLDDPRLPKLLSRRHCRLQLLSDGQIQIQDLGSLNGTFVEGPLGTDGSKQLRQLQPRSTPTMLLPGDTLMLGGTDTVLDLHSQVIPNPFKFLVCPPACGTTAVDAGAGRQQAATAAAGEPHPEEPCQNQQPQQLSAHTCSSQLPAAASTGQRGPPVQHGAAGRPNSSTPPADQVVHQRSALQASAIVNIPQHQQQQAGFEAAARHQQQQHQQHQQQQHAGITVVGVCEPAPVKRHRGSSLPPADKPDSWQLQQQAVPAAGSPQSQPLPAAPTAAGTVEQTAAGHAVAEWPHPWSSHGAAALDGVPAAAGLLAAADAAAGDSAADVQGAVHRRSTPQRAAAAAAVRRAAAGGAGCSAAEQSAVLAAVAGAAAAAGAAAGGVDTVDLTESAPPDTDLGRAGHATEAEQPPPSTAAAAAAGAGPGATPPSAVRQRKRAWPPSSGSKDVRRVKASTLECSICRELLVATHTLGCGHLFCGPCLAQWLEMQAHPSCPTCRAAVQGVPLRVYALDGLVADAVLSSGSEPQELAARLEAWEAIRAHTTARWQELFSSSSGGRSRGGRKAAARPTAAAGGGAAGGGGSRGGGGRERAGGQQQAAPELVHLREGDRHLLSGLRHPPAAAAAAGSGEAPPAATAGMAARRRGVSSRRGGRNARQRQPAGSGAAAGRAGRGAAQHHQQQQQQQAPLRSLRQAAIDSLFL